MQGLEKSKQLFERAKQVAPGGVHSPVRAFRGVGGTPCFIDSARGAEIFDVDGNRYLDFCMSWGPMLFGHRDEEILAAVEKALSKGWSFGAAEPYSLELAELITKNIPWAEKIRFVNSGTEAVMSALRVARAATGRNKVLKFEGCYHGHVDSMLVKAGSGLAEMASPDSAGVSNANAADTLVLPLRDLAALDEAFSLHGNELAAVIVEPVPANNGLLAQTDEFLNRIASLCKKHGTLLIFDEVITGFRVGFGGMAEKCGITPDLVTYGKVIGGGFPIGAYAGKRELMDWVAPVGPVYQAGTLSANPVAVSAGLAMLKKILRENPYEKLALKTQSVASTLEKVAAEKGMALKVQSYASLFWMVFGEIKTVDGVVRTVSEIPAAQKEAFAPLFHKFLDKGVYLAPSAFEVSFLSTAHSDTQLDYFLESFRKI